VHRKTVRNADRAQENCT